MKYLIRTEGKNSAIAELWIAAVQWEFRGKLKNENTEKKIVQGFEHIIQIVEFRNCEDLKLSVRENVSGTLKVKFIRIPAQDKINSRFFRLCRENVSFLRHFFTGERKKS